MKTLSVAVSTAVVTLTWVGQALASIVPPINNVPEPTTLGLLAAGTAAVTLGARWFRRK